MPRGAASSPSRRPWRSRGGGSDCESGRFDARRPPVLRGDTYHFEVVANESSRVLMDVLLKPPAGCHAPDDRYEDQHGRARQGAEAVLVATRCSPAPGAAQSGATERQGVGAATARGRSRCSSLRLEDPVARPRARAHLDGCTAAPHSPPSYAQVFGRRNSLKSIRRTGPRLASLSPVARDPADWRLRTRRGPETPFRWCCTSYRAGKSFGGTDGPNSVTACWRSSRGLAPRGDRPCPARRVTVCPLNLN